MGKPTYLISIITWIYRVIRWTRRTETSKYPKEKKSIEIPKVVASEIGLAVFAVYYKIW